MTSARLAVVVLLALASPAWAQSADSIQARMAEALDDLINADRLSKEAEAAPEGADAKRVQAADLWTHAVDVYAAVLADVERVELPPAGRDEVIRIALYNSACAHARLGHQDVALDTLARTLEAGYQEFAHIERDPDLASLRDTPRFVQLLERARSKLAEAARAEASKLLSERPLFDYDFDVTTLDGQRLTLGSLEGKVVIVDFWGTWCPPCRKEIPHFVALQEKYGDQLAIVGMTFEQGQEGPEIEAKVRRFAEQVGINYPLVMAKAADLRRVPDLEAFPTTLFLDKAGRVRAREVGYRDEGAIDALIQALLAEEAPAAPRPPSGGIGPF
jgi:thiol-disulfide isomerase/thioredoxin